MLVRLFLATALVATPTLAAAQVCSGDGVPRSADGRMLGHLPYGDVVAEDLVAAPDGFALRQGCMIRRDMLPDLIRLLDAARGDPAVMGQLRGLSCHRSLGRQGAVFCREGADGDAADRAISVAPPGHSEHTTGYAIDFAVRPSPNCPDAETCMAATPAYRWLVANAPIFGFEQSFPISNRQRVKWEPWHWRWVGISSDATGAARARFVFSRARRDFPANPAVVPPIAVTTMAQPPLPSVASIPADPKARRKRR